MEENKETNESALLTEEVGRLVGALYNIVDQIFIANAPELGSCGCWRRRPAWARWRWRWWSFVPAR